MRSSVRIGFSMPWHEVKAHLDPGIADDVEKRLNPYFDMSAVVDLDPHEELATRLLKCDTVVKGQSLIDLVRETIRLDPSDITESGVYKLILAPDHDDSIHLIGEPSDYYRIITDCEHCGRYIWIQDKELQLATPLIGDMDKVICDEIVVSQRFRDAVANKGLRGLSFRSISGATNVWQLIAEKKATVKRPNQFLHELRHCTVCGKPRLVRYENTNGVPFPLPKRPSPVPRIERVAPLLLSEMPGDFACTDMEFGTLGGTPEGAPPSSPDDFPYNVSYPLWVVSGKLCKVLFQEGISGFDLAPAACC